MKRFTAIFCLAFLPSLASAGTLELQAKCNYHSKKQINVGDRFFYWYVDTSTNESFVINSTAKLADDVFSQATPLYSAELLIPAKVNELGGIEWVETDASGVEGGYAIPFVGAWAKGRSGILSVLSYPLCKRF